MHKTIKMVDNLEVMDWVSKLSVIDGPQSP